MSGKPLRKPGRTYLFGEPKSRVAETTDFDPRYDRAQTIEGAKARYVSDDANYSLDDLERDVSRILDEGGYPDREDVEGYPTKSIAMDGGQVVRLDSGAVLPPAEGSTALW